MALDGLRAFALLIIMGYHFGVAHLGGGFFSLDIFYVLSGYLITGLLLGEWARAARIRLGAFWLAGPGACCPPCAWCWWWWPWWSGSPTRPASTPTCAWPTCRPCSTSPTGGRSPPRRQLLRGHRGRLPPHPHLVARRRGAVLPGVAPGGAGRAPPGPPEVRATPGGSGPRPTAGSGPPLRGPPDAPTGGSRPCWPSRWGWSPRPARWPALPPRGGHHPALLRHRHPRPVDPGGGGPGLRAHPGPAPPGPHGHGPGGRHPAVARSVLTVVGLAGLAGTSPSPPPCGHQRPRLPGRLPAVGPVGRRHRHRGGVRRRRTHRPALSLRPMVWMGTVSYGAYLWHFPVCIELDSARTGLGGPGPAGRAGRRHLRPGRRQLLPGRAPGHGGHVLATAHRPRPRPWPPGRHRRGGGGRHRGPGVGGRGRAHDRRPSRRRAPGAGRRRRLHLRPGALPAGGRLDGRDRRARARPRQRRELRRAGRQQGRARVRPRRPRRRHVGRDRHPRVVVPPLALAVVGGGRPLPTPTSWASWPAGGSSPTTWSTAGRSRSTSRHGTATWRTSSTRWSACCRRRGEGRPLHHALHRPSQEDAGRLDLRPRTASGSTSATGSSARSRRGIPGEVTVIDTQPDPRPVRDTSRWSWTG